MGKTYEISPSSVPREKIERFPSREEKKRNDDVDEEEKKNHESAAYMAIRKKRH